MIVPSIWEQATLKLQHKFPDKFLTLSINIYTTSEIINGPVWQASSSFFLQISSIYIFTNFASYGKRLKETETYQTF